MRHWCGCLLTIFVLVNLVAAASALESRAHQRSAKAVRKTSEFSSKQKIPKLLHYIYLKGYDAFMEGNNTTPQLEEQFKTMKGYFEQCQKLHNHWDSLFWDEKLGRDLIEREYSWFLPIWDGYDVEAKKSDALRVFIMHQYGGLYLDFDIECYKPADDSMQEFDLMMQGTGNEGFNNAVMASVPGHYFWMGYAATLQKRGPGPFPGIDRNMPKFMTGTVAMTVSVVEHIHSPRPISGYLGGVFESNNTMVKVWPLGEWFVPCFGLDHICIKHLEEEKTRSLWDMTNVYGRHYFLETSPKTHLLYEMRDFYVH